MQAYTFFNNQLGTHYVTLQPGNYAVACRNQSTGSNTFHAELDNGITLPSSDNCIFNDIYVQGEQEMTAGQWAVQPFTIQTGYRYYVDGCNTSVNCYLIDATQSSAFESGGQFTYYKAYSGENSPDQPGFYEVVLPPGDYALAFRNPTSSPQGLTYTMERWKQQ